jgi:hypothetical protein
MITSTKMSPFISEEEYAEGPASKCRLFAEHFAGREGELCGGCLRFGVRCLGCSHPPRPIVGKSALFTLLIVGFIYVYHQLLLPRPQVRTISCILLFAFG